MDNHAIVLFDGVCNLCNSSVKFIIKRDSKDYFRFAALQNYNTENLAAENKSLLADFNSIILIENDKFYTRSTAALRIAQKMDGLWKLMYVFIIVPPFIRNIIYDFIAANRYKWFGKKENCLMPTDELKKKFV